MKQINNYIIEKLHINKNTGKEQIENKIDMSLLESFTQDDIDKIINFVEDMPSDIQPKIITNVKKNESVTFSEYELYLFYDKDYEEKSIYALSYIRFFYSEYDGLSMFIYDSKNKKYYNSKTWYNNKDINKCFDFIKSKYDLLRKIL